jgi:hypothetical protein
VPRVMQWAHALPVQCFWWSGDRQCKTGIIIIIIIIIIIASSSLMPRRSA